MMSPKDHVVGNENNPNPIQFGARIKVVGVGGSGSNAVDHMINSGIRGVDFIVMNCDTQDLHNSLASKKIHIGRNLTRGLGTGMNPDIGRQAAEETKNEIQETLKDTDLVFIACGLGGGTATGAAPIIGEAARKQGALSVAVVTKPFSFEGAKRARIAEEGLEELIKVVDTVIVVPNDRLLEIADNKISLKKVFILCDSILKNAVQGISDLIVKPGIVNLDFADVKTVMTETGFAIVGIGRAKGNDRAVKAAQKAINSPLLDISIDGAKGVLLAIAGGDDLTLSEINEAAEVITESADPEAKIIFGAFHDQGLNKEEVKITVIAAGFPHQDSKITTLSRAKDFGARRDKEDIDQEKDIDKAEQDGSMSEDDSNENDSYEVPAFIRKKMKQFKSTRINPKISRN